MKALCVPPTSKYESIHRNVQINTQMGIMTQKCSSYKHISYVDRNYCNISIRIYVRIIIPIIIMETYAHKLDKYKNIDNNHKPNQCNG